MNAVAVAVARDMPPACCLAWRYLGSGRRRAVRLLRHRRWIPDRAWPDAGAPAWPWRSGKRVADCGDGVRHCLRRSYAWSGLIDWPIAMLLVAGGVVGSLGGRAAERPGRSAQGLAQPSLRLVRHCRRCLCQHPGLGSADRLRLGLEDAAAGLLLGDVAVDTRGHDGQFAECWPLYHRDLAEIRLLAFIFNEAIEEVEKHEAAPPTKAFGRALSDTRTRLIVRPLSDPPTHWFLGRFCFLTSCGHERLGARAESLAILAPL